jgi:23S rRNA C2498 (ribose-2'-O)-methylase RlmM
VNKSLKDIEDELDALQVEYLDEEDDRKQTSIVRKFTQLLDDATEIDGELRNAAGVTIHNWTREVN